MDRGTFAGYLAGLDEAALAGLLRVRPDVRVEPVPRGFGQLAQRLSGPDSLVAALQLVNGTAVAVGQAVAALGPAATVEALARLFGASDAAVREAVDDLCRRGLMWVDGDTVCLPDRLAMHWSAEVGGRPVATIGRSALADDLRSTAEALGIEVAGLRKPELITRLGDVLADARAVADLVRRLPKPARDRLDQLRHGYGQYYPGYVGNRDPGSAHADRMVAAAGLVLRVNGHWEIPREVAVAAWLAEREPLLAGRPDIPRGNATAASVLATAQAAVRDTLQAITALLDDAGSSPITALKKGGVGPRERSRLAARLSLPADVLLLGIDLAYAAGLLGRVDAGYAPTEQYSTWRTAEPSRQWAALVTTWFELEHAPTSREIDGEKELPPPLPLASAAGMIRRALLRAATGGLAVRATGEHIDWFCPLHGYDKADRDNKVTAAVREAELLGVVASDVVTGCGELLSAVLDQDGDDAESVSIVDKLAGLVSDLLPELPCTVILQSDLTAVVSGQPTVAVSRVLAASALSEARGTAAVWRFTPASVRTALDAGWTATQLLAGLTALSDRPLPQPLEYLINDVARRHGQVRVRGMRSCVLADEAVITEILHTRSLAKLGFARLAPTVLSSPHELDDVLAQLRTAGLSPVAEDVRGTVIIEAKAEHRAAAVAAAVQARPRARLGATELAEQLLADPHGDASGGMDVSNTFDQLAALNPNLDDAELMLLSDAVDHQHDVRITYRNNSGSQTVRAIQPRQFYGRWLDSWCHLRNARREFTVANIESVAPVG